MPTLVTLVHLMDLGPVGTVTPPVDSFYILQEDGFKITLEDGSGFLLLETAP